MDYKNTEIVKYIQNDDVEELKKYEKKDLNEMKIKNLNLSFGDYKNNYFNGDVLSLLHVAALNNSIKCFDFLINEVLIPIDIKSELGFYPLHYSLAFGLYEISYHILSIYKNNFNKADSSVSKSAIEDLFLMDYCNTNKIFNLLFNCASYKPNYNQLSKISDLLFDFGYEPDKIESVENQFCYFCSLKIIRIRR